MMKKCLSRFKKRAAVQTNLVLGLIFQPRRISSGKMIARAINLFTIVVMVLFYNSTIITTVAKAHIDTVMHTAWQYVETTLASISRESCYFLVMAFMAGGVGMLLVRSYKYASKKRQDLIATYFISAFGVMITCLIVSAYNQYMQNTPMGQTTKFSLSLVGIWLLVMLVAFLAFPYMECWEKAITEEKLKKN